MSNVPDNVRQPQDRKPAAQAEAEGDETVAVEYRGRTYDLPADPQDWPVKVMREFEAERNTTAAALLLTTVGVDADNWSTRRLAELFDTYAQVAGFADRGE